ncbi:gluconate 2-dehydrogenase subunit 3 family protein [Flavobacteriaceae bacterium F89]|uniref:Gluconate 2-dehydrogenase subunit 3 family protein n=1 Tax=Cerina litoralis TaxID=2874477 RepID=A0AAE3EXL0_9FLAO|nr:gluconate 2-dehydrogenase subunit 3 family protein [Cerina litoralis]MCG2462108.1 gluconate 2-dehydrogenase subunit 3 family protein [Cerina litoralis]
MDRRKSIKSIFLGSVAGGMVLNGCKPEVDSKAEAPAVATDHYSYGRTPEEKEQISKLEAEKFFNEHEMGTMAVLCALILPANDKYGNATDAGVPDFIEFMSKDIPSLQTPLRGGFMWLDHKSNTDFGKEFKSISEDQQKQILDEIAYPDPKLANSEQPLQVQFFALMRSLTMTGYYTSEEGIKDLGYKGNSPNVWDGVPEDVLAQHGLAYEEEWLAKCVDQSKRNVQAEWDDEGNLLT